MSITLDEFIQSITISGLMEAEEIRSFIDVLPMEQQPRTAEDLAKELYRAGRVTKFQAQAIYQKKTRGLAVGNYVVLDKLGKGGMGAVYKAQHKRMKRIVALKMLPSSATKSSDSVKRFQQEVEAAARLSHPNIVTAYDADEAKGVHFLVMEYVEGRDLFALVKEKGTLSVARAVDYAVQAAKGLEYAHAQGVIHRDIKPHNLLLDNNGTVKILDMGLARIEEAVAGTDAMATEGLTQSGQVMGTLDYMPPEQALDTSTVDLRADIYSLGCTLHYLLTGKPPYSGDTVGKKIVAHRENPIPCLRGLRSDVPESLDAVFQKMLAKRPEGRPQSMSEVISQLQGCALAPGAAASSMSLPDASPYSQTVDFLRGDTKPPAESLSPLEELFASEPVEITERLAAPSFRYQKRSKKRQKAVVTVVAGGAAVLLVILGLVLAISGRRETATSVAAGVVPESKADATTKAPALAVAPFDAATARTHQEAWAKHLGVSVKMTNSVGMQFVLIPPGEFMMGSPAETIELEKTSSEGPRHSVRITKPFFLGMFEVTQEEYQQVMGENPSSFSAAGGGKDKVAGQDTRRFPVDGVTWDKAFEFCRKLSELPDEKAKSRRYRVPTEAQWEYACRAGTVSRWHFGDAAAQLGEFGWFDGNSGGSTHPVGQLKANPWGLYDMHGNVIEWTADWYDDKYYAGSPVDDPCETEPHSHTVDRGGSWATPPEGGRSAFRWCHAPGLVNINTGFRAVCEIDPQRPGDDAGAPGGRSPPGSPASKPRSRSAKSP
jgi:eukaryotic-like serine/threonine-protein kinase